MELLRIFCYYWHMFDVFLAELLILSMLVLLSLRIFFTKRARIDAAAILAPTSFVFSLLVLYIWGADSITLLLVLFTFFALIINVRSVMRFSARVVVDYYSARYVIPMILILLFSLGLITLLIIFRPVRYFGRDFGVTREKTTLTGNLTTGLYERTTVFEQSGITGMLYTYEKMPADSDEKSEKKNEIVPTVIFVPKCSAQAVHYEPYFLMLAQKGCRVLSAEYNAFDRELFDLPLLNSRFFRRFYTLWLWFKDRKEFNRTIEKDTAYALKTYRELAKIALNRYGKDTQILFAVEEIGIDALNELTSAFAENSLGFYALNRLPEYTTTNFGFLAQTDVLLAYTMGISRDNSFFIPRYVAAKTMESIEQAKKLLEPVEIIKTDGEEGEEK